MPGVIPIPDFLRAQARAGRYPAARPILFSAPMVRAILAGTKTQTRRIVKACKDRELGCELAPNEVAGEVNAGDFSNSPWIPGDRLWVREAWAVNPYTPEVRYRATDALWTDVGPVGWRPSIHMPRALSRLTLEVTAVSVERLQDITEAGAICEGVERSDINAAAYRDYMDPLAWCGDAVTSYRTLWDQINGGGSWPSNPWVWVVDFQPLS